MTSTTLISVTELYAMYTHREVLVIDCRFDLNDPTLGERDYDSGHIPGAHYLHLNRDLSDLSKIGFGRLFIY